MYSCTIMCAKQNVGPP